MKPTEIINCLNQNKLLSKKKTDVFTDDIEFRVFVFITVYDGEYNGISSCEDISIISM